MTPECSNLVKGMILGYPTSDVVLGSKVKVRVRVNSNTAWIRTLDSSQSGPNNTGNRKIQGT